MCFTFTKNLKKTVITSYPIYVAWFTRWGRTPHYIVILCVTVCPVMRINRKSTSASLHVIFGISCAQSILNPSWDCQNWIWSNVMRLSVSSWWTLLYYTVSCKTGVLVLHVFQCSFRFHKAPGGRRYCQCCCVCSLYTTTNGGMITVFVWVYTAKNSVYNNYYATCGFYNELKLMNCKTIIYIQ